MVADSAFPVSTYVMPAIKRTLANNPKKRRYNKKLSRTRIIVEHSLGACKNIWRRLYKIKAKIPKAVKIISSCLVLHNFLIFRGENVANYGNVDQAQQNRWEQTYAEDYFSIVDGKDKRDELIDFLFL